MKDIKFHFALGVVYRLGYNDYGLAATVSYITSHSFICETFADDTFTHEWIQPDLDYIA